MKKTGILILLGITIWACEEQNSQYNLLTDLSVICDSSIQKVTDRYYYRGALPFARPIITNLSKAQDYRKKILIGENYISEYRSTLLTVETQIKNLDSSEINSLRTFESEEFLNSDKKVQLFSLFFYENWLTQQLNNKYFHYSYLFDIAEPLLTVNSESITLGDTLDGELFITVGNSALIFFTELEIIDLATGKIEKQINKETASGESNKIKITYSPNSVGEKLITGHITFPHEGRDVKLDFDKQIKINSR